MAFYAPTNPRTPTQQAWRAKLSTGWGQWNALTESEKAAYYVEARTYRLSAPQLFMRRYLQSQR